MKKVDLHLHSTFSDGTYSPETIVQLAHTNGLSAIAIADHDEISGFSPAYKVGKELGVDVIPAIEFSGSHCDRSFHILGYFIDPADRQLLDFLLSMRKARLIRAEKIVHKFQSVGISIELTEIEEHSGIGVICRTHIADVLVSKGIVSDLRSAFSKYLGWDCPCYVSKSNISTQYIIDLIRKSGGIPALAHPSHPDVGDLIYALIKEGLMGIEVWYPTASKSTIDYYLKITDEYGLVPTGGSDSHGARPRYPNIGEFYVPYEVLDRLIDLHNRI